MRRLYKGERKGRRGDEREREREGVCGELGQLGRPCETVGVGAHYKTA